MKRILIISLITLSFIGINVNAASESATSDQANYTTMQSMYNKYANGEKISVSSEQIVTIYGRSICSGSSCTYNYAGLTVGQDFKAALSKVITCSNGVRKISYQNSDATAKTDFMDDNKAQASGTVYWSEEYYVACTANGSLEVVEDNSGIDVENKDNVNTNVSDYDTSTPEDNPGTGVSTYFAVLGLVAVISYMCTIFIKKYNLFKKI